MQPLSSLHKAVINVMGFKALIPGAGAFVTGEMSCHISKGINFYDTLTLS